MRVLLLTQWFAPEPEFKNLTLAKALCERGHEVEVLTGFPNYPEGELYAGYSIRPWRREVMDGMRVNRVALYPSHDGNGLRRICNYLSFGGSAAAFGPWLVRKPDIVYVYNLVTLGLAARLMRLLRGAKVVLDVQDLWPESVASSGMMRNRLLNKVLRLWCRAEYSAPDHIVVLSPGFKANLIARGISESKIDVVYNWCDEMGMVVPEPDERVAEELGFKGRFNVVFAGTLGVMQALDVVIDAARRLADVAPDVLFTLVGAGVDAARLKTLATGLTNIQFLPSRPRAAIGRVLAVADALLVHLKDDPLFRITIPSKIQAYLYSGQPLLCGVLGDAAELVNGARAGICFTPGDADSLAHAVLTLRSCDASARHAMGSAGRKFYLENMALEQGVSRFEELFCRLLGR